MESEGSGFIVEKKGPIGYIYFNRPEKLNAWRQKDYEAFEDIVNDFERDEQGVVMPRPEGRLTVENMAFLPPGSDTQPMLPQREVWMDMV